NRKGRWTTKCPTCGDAYLSVEIKRDRVVWDCKGCDEGGGESFEPKKKSDLGPITAIYDYNDEAGTRLFQVLRFEPGGQGKTFRQRTGPDQEKWSIQGVRLVPFRLPQLIEAIGNDNTALIVEGEKDVLTLARHNVAATTNPMGVGKWRADFAEFFR